MTAGRPRNFDIDEALATATGVFWKQGFRGTSLDDLVGTLGLSRSSFYAAFRSKEHLFVDCLRHYCETQATAMEEGLEASPSALGFIRQVLEQVVSEAREASPCGCLLVNSANEVAASDPELAREIRRLLDRFEGIFRKAIQRARAAGEISAEAEDETLAAYLATNVGGLRSQAKAGLPADRIKKIVQQILRSLE